MDSLLPLLCLVLAGTQKVEGSDPNLPFMEYLDQNHLVCLKWGFDNQQVSITFKLLVNTTGWVGFGFSPNGGMKGSDIVMGGVGPSGPYFSDYYAKGNSPPLEDAEQSYTLLSLEEEEGQTIMTFQRSILSCDEQDFNINAQSIKLIYAYGPTDDIMYHRTFRGTKDVNLLNHMSRTPITSNRYLNATMDNVAVPPTETYYHCKITRLSTLQSKHHIYMIEPLIENPDIVHHLLLYRCPPQEAGEAEKPCSELDGKGMSCLEVVAIWAVGGKEYELPENAGIPVGGEISDTFYKLEIHYNNIKKETGRTDSSGLRLHYRPVAQRHDVGTMMTGLIPGFQMPYAIPPGVRRFHTYGVCNTTRFPQLMNAVPDLHVFAVVLHTHYAGTAVRAGLFRGGEQIGFVAVDENYDFERQQVVNLGNITTIKPGDEILVECTYSTVNRTGVTEMGLGSYDEMCLAFLLYYPAIGITSCLSHPNTHHPAMGSGYQNLTSDQEEVLKYEALLKELPQLEMISDVHHNLSFYEDGMIRDMMKTPKVTCQTNSASGRLYTSWILNPAESFLLLFWIIVIQHI